MRDTQGSTWLDHTHIYINTTNHIQTLPRSYKPYHAHANAAMRARMHATMRKLTTFAPVPHLTTMKETHFKSGQLGQATDGVPVLALEPVGAGVSVRVVESRASGKEKEPLRLPSFVVGGRRERRRGAQGGVIGEPICRGF